VRRILLVSLTADTCSCATRRLTFPLTSVVYHAVIHPLLLLLQREPRVVKQTAPKPWKYRVAGASS